MLPPESPPADDKPASLAPLPAEAPAPALPHTPVNVQGAAFTFLVILAGVFALQWSRQFLIPVVFSIFLAYTLNPLVAVLERVRLPRMLATILLLFAILAGATLGASTVRTEFNGILENLPAATSKISRAITQAQKGQPSTMQRVRTAAAEIEKAASQATGIGSAPSKSRASASSGFQLDEWLWAGSMGAAGAVAQATMVLFLVFFLLLSGDTFKRKLVRITGPSLSRKKIAVHILDDINVSIQNYMFMLLVTNTLLGLLMWGALRWIGLENAGAWAIAAALLHIIPYFGPLMITVAASLTALMQFESWPMALLVGGTSLGIATLVGTFVTTWMTGRIAKMNPTAVFIGLLFWGWLWGIWGMLLGIPIIVILKVIAEHVPGMQAIAELLGE